MYWATPNITTVKSNMFRTCILWIKCCIACMSYHTYINEHTVLTWRKIRGRGNLPPCHRSQSPTFKNDTLACVLVLDDGGAKTSQKLQRCNVCSIYWTVFRYVTQTQHGGSWGTHCFHSRVSLFNDGINCLDHKCYSCVHTVNTKPIYTSLTPSVKKKLREKPLFYETRRFITSLQGPANELNPEHISYSHTQFFHVFTTTYPILRSWVKSRDMLVIITVWISTTAPWRLTATAYLIVYNRRNPSEFLWIRKQYSRVPYMIWNFYTNWMTARFYVPFR